MQKIEYGCGFADVFCAVAEGSINAVANVMSGLAQSVLQVPDGEENALIGKAIGFANPWVGFAVVVMMIVGICVCSLAIFRRRWNEAVQAAVVVLLAYPIVQGAYIVVGWLLSICDELAAGFTHRLIAPGGQVEQVLGWLADPGGQAFAAGAGGHVENYLVVFGKQLLFFVLMIVALVLIACTFAFRSFALLLLLGFGPLAFMMLSSVRSGSSMVRKWVAMVCTVALAKPLTISALLLALSLVGTAGLSSLVGVLTIFVGFVMAAFMPLAIYQFFDFVGGSFAADGVGARLGGRGVQMVGQRVRQLQAAGSSAVASVGSGLVNTVKYRKAKKNNNNNNNNGGGGNDSGGGKSGPPGGVGGPLPGGAGGRGKNERPPSSSPLSHTTGVGGKEKEKEKGKGSGVDDLALLPKHTPQQLGTQPVEGVGEEKSESEGELAAAGQESVQTARRHTQHVQESAPGSGEGDQKHVQHSPPPATQAGTASAPAANRTAGGRGDGRVSAATRMYQHNQRAGSSPSVPSTHHRGGRPGSEGGKK